MAGISPGFPRARESHQGVCWSAARFVGPIRPETASGLDWRSVPPGSWRVTLRRRLLAEGIGSLILAATVVGSGIMGERLAGGNIAVALLANTGATVAVLATLIAMLGPISGAHFNPAVSLIQAVR